MSCEAHRLKAFKSIAAQVGASPEELEKIFSAYRSGAVTKLVNAAQVAVDTLDGHGATEEMALLTRAVKKVRRALPEDKTKRANGKTILMRPAQPTPLDEAAEDLCGPNAVVGIVEDYDGYVEIDSDGITEHVVSVRVPMGYDAQGRAVQMSRRSGWWSEHEFYEVGENEGVVQFIKDYDLEQELEKHRITGASDFEREQITETLAKARDYGYQGQTVSVMPKGANGEPQHFYDGGMAREWVGGKDGKARGKEMEIVRAEKDKVWVRVDVHQIKAYKTKELVVSSIPSDIRSNSVNQDALPPYNFRNENDDEVAGPFFTLGAARQARRKKKSLQGANLCNGYSNSVTGE